MRLTKVLLVCSLTAGILAGSALVAYEIRFISDSPLYATRLIVERVLLGKRKVIERNGWLFYQQCLSSMIRPWPIGDHVRRITTLSARLRQRGIVLVVVPVPNKEEVYPEKLTGLSPVVTSRQRENLVRRLQEQGVEAIDLLPIFRASRMQPLYYVNDTHWNQGGINLAASVIAERVRSIAPARPVRSFESRDTVVREIGDLTSLLWGDDSALYSPRTYAMVYSVGLFMAGDSVDANTVVIGDSYARSGEKFNAHLGAHVARALSRQVKTVVSLNANGGGLGVIARVLSKNAGNVKVVVWVLTARALDAQLSDPVF